MRVLTNEKGVLLVSVAVLSAVLGLLMLAAGSRTTHDQLSTFADESNVEAFFAAEAGEQMMVASFRDDAINQFNAAIANWNGEGPVLANPQNFLQSNVALNGVSLDNGSSFANVNATIGFAGQQIEPDAQSYIFDYTVSSTGMEGQRPSDMVVIQSTGRLVLSVESLSFASFALFTNTHTLPSGTRVWFTNTTNFTGRVHTNGRFNFALNPGASFENGPVTSVSQDAWFYNNGRPIRLDADRNGDRDVPTFGEGFFRGVDAMPLPANAFDQKEVALGVNLVDPESNAEIRGALGLPVNNDPPPDGVYVLNDGWAVTAGIYIQGDVCDMALEADDSGNQNYNIRLCSGGTSTISVNQGLNQTVADGQVYSGVPEGLIYTAGRINSLGGPDRVGGEPPPAIQSDTALTLVAEGDVVMTNDITYTDNPLEVTDATNILGIFTPGGDIRIGTSAPDDIVIHSTLMTSDTTGVVQVDNYRYGSYRGVATILGGLVSSYYGAFGTFSSRRGQMTGYSRNFVHDDRLGSGYVPPFFPNTTVFQLPTADVTRVSWSKTIQHTH